MIPHAVPGGGSGAAAQADGGVSSSLAMAPVTVVPWMASVRSNGDAVSVAAALVAGQVQMPAN